MDLSTALNAPIVRKFDGTEITFPKLTARELSAFGEEIKSARREQVKIDTAELKLDPVAKYRALQEPQISGDVYVEDIAFYISTPKVAPRIIEKSLEKSGQKEHAEKVLAAMDVLETRELARDIAGVQFIFKQPEKKAPENPNQQTGHFGGNPLP